jgi:hypothetical protein
MSNIDSTHRKLLVMALGVAIVAALGISLAYAQTSQVQTSGQTLQTANHNVLYQSQGSQMNYMADMGHGGIGAKGMCHHGNMTMSQTPSKITPSSTSESLT